VEWLSPAEARALIAHPSLAAGGPQTWADLGCGDGIFTVALASLLPGGSVVHGMDINAGALKRVPTRRGGVAIVTHVGDFTNDDRDRGRARRPGCKAIG
jgi:ubiquinone/menaquinone biosynthesis C-methylase UbiE